MPARSSATIATREAARRMAALVARLSQTWDAETDGRSARVWFGDAAAAFRASAETLMIRLTAPDAASLALVERVVDGALEGLDADWSRPRAA